MSLVLIIGGFAILFSKNVKYSSGINRNFLFRGIAGFFGAKEAEYELTGLAKNSLAIVLIICGLSVLIYTIVNFRWLL